MTLFKVVLPKHCRVLLLEDSDMRIEWFRRRIPKLTVVKSVSEFIDYFKSKPLVDFIFFDHDLGKGGSGLDAAKWLRENFGSGNRWGLIHSWNRTGARAMQDIMPAVVAVPFGEFEIEID